MAFKKYMKDEPTPEVPPEIPSKAGAPEIEVKKTWAIGTLRVISRGGKVEVSRDYGDRLNALRNWVSLDPKECAALADALLQAAP